MSSDDVALNDAADMDADQTDERTDEQTDERTDEEKLKEAVEVEVSEAGPLRKKLTITVPRDLIDERVSKQFDDLRNEATVPGFRRGRAPMKLLEKRFGGDVGEQVGSGLITGSYLAAVEKQSLDVLGDPLVNVTVPEEQTDEKGVVKTVDVERLLPVDKALDHLKLPKEGPLVYSCEVEVRPEFDLPELEGIEVEKVERKITNEDVEDEIHRLLALRGTFRPVEKGGAKPDDLVVGNVRVRVDGQVVKTEDNAELAVRDQRYDGVLLEGFGDACKGRKPGDSVSFEVTIPDDDDNVGIRGKSAQWEMQILELKRLSVPELTDELVSSLGFDSAGDLRAYLRTGLELEIYPLVRRHMREQITEYLLDKTPFDVPEGVSQRQTERIVAQRMMELYRRGKSESEIMKQVDELRLVAQKESRDMLRLYFILDKIAEQLEISVSEEELNGAIAEIAQRRNRRFDRVRDELVSNNHLSTLYLKIRDEKVVDQLLESAKITDIQVPKKDAAKSSKPTAKKKSASRATRADKKTSDD